MGIVDGQPVDAANSNPAWLAAIEDDFTTGVLGLKNVATGIDIDNIQLVAIRLMAATGVDETTNDGTTYGAPSSTITDGDSHETALTKLANKFDSSTGHDHSGAAGTGKKIDAGNLTSPPFRASVFQGADLSTITGTSTDVSTELSGKSPSTSPATLGVVVNAPENKIILRQATGSETDDVFTDANGDIVFGRLTEAASVFTLSFFVDQSGVEVAHDFTGSVDIRWYYQEIFNSLDGSAPVYSEFALIPSDNATADVINATEGLFGKVRLATSVETNSDVVQSQDSRLPVQDENDALVGTNGTPSTSNKYVTNSDPRNSDQRDADSIQGVDVDPSLAPADGQILKFVDANSRFEAADDETGGVVNKNVESFNSVDTLDSANDVALCDASGGGFTITLPSAIGITGKVYDIVKIEDSTNSILIDTSLAQLIGTRAGAAIGLNRLNDYIRVLSDGTNWEILAKKETEILTAVASGTVTFAGRTAADFLASSADVPLTEGIWKLRAYFSLDIGTGTFTGLLEPSGLYSADGANSAATPAALSAGANVSSVDGDPTMVQYSTTAPVFPISSGTNSRFPAGFVEVIVVVDGGTETVFAVPNIDFVTAGTARTDAYIRAERIW